jgi:hypothetical protein
MVTDKKGKEVLEGDVIKFKSSEITYKVVSEYGELGCYEDYKFIPLSKVLKNFEVVS